jgi:hypothetical protein
VTQAVNAPPKDRISQLAGQRQPSSDITSAATKPTIEKNKKRRIRLHNNYL